VPNRRFFRTVPGAVTMAVVFSGCAYNGSVQPPRFASSALARAERQRSIPQVSGFAYIAVPGDVYEYSLPLQATSQPLRQIGNLNAPGAIGFDPGQVFVLVAGSPSGEGILVYEPRKNGPVSFVLPTPLLPEMLEVNKSGDVFQGQTYVNGSYVEYQINVFKHPIDKGRVPAFTMNAAVNNAGSGATRGMAFDRQGNLWVKDDDNQTMDKFVPPFSSKSVPALTFLKGPGAPYGSMIFDRHNTMFVSNGNAVDVYEPPFTRKTIKAFSIAASLANILAVDSAGDLYVTSGNGVVYVFVPPLDASSVPAVTMPIPGSPTLSFMTIRQ
jgi:hypothetical protein